MIKSVFKKNKICVICASVFISWVFFLILYWKGKFLDKTIIAILIGESTLGIFYLIENKTKEEFKVFLLPVLLTLILMGYGLIEGFNYSQNVLYFLTMIWTLFFIIYSFKDKEKLGKLIRKIIECCKKW
ncbi:hypothetical protein J4442_03210 [Candidatus Woesearchaeota archaeon]|nr:hypothetical protein [Candidatus Woesearchaeota archaeon]